MRSCHDTCPWCARLRYVIKHATEDTKHVSLSERYWRAGPHTTASWKGPPRSPFKTVARRTTATLRTALICHRRDIRGSIRRTWIARERERNREDRIARREVLDSGYAICRSRVLRRIRLDALSAMVLSASRSFSFRVRGTTSMTQVDPRAKPKGSRTGAPA